MEQLNASSFFIGRFSKIFNIDAFDLYKGSSEIFIKAIELGNFELVKFLYNKDRLKNKKLLKMDNIKLKEIAQHIVQNDINYKLVRFLFEIGYKYKPLRTLVDKYGDYLN